MPAPDHLGAQFGYPKIEPPPKPWHEEEAPPDPGPYEDTPEWLEKRKAMENHARIRNLLGRTDSGELWPIPKQRER